MKKITLLFASVLVSTFALASEPGDGSTPTGLAVVKKNETTFNLFYHSAGLSNVKVSILDAEGKKIFSESFKKTDGFIRPYNFDGMKQGEYTISVESNNETIKETFKYGEVDAKAANVLKLADNKYMVAIRGALLSGKVTIRIYNGTKLLHQQDNEITGDFGQLFTLKNVDDGVTFRITDSQGKIIN